MRGSNIYLSIQNFKETIYQIVQLCLNCSHVKPSWVAVICLQHTSTRIRMFQLLLHQPSPCVCHFLHPLSSAQFVTSHTCKCVFRCSCCVSSHTLYPTGCKCWVSIKTVVFMFVFPVYIYSSGINLLLNTLWHLNYSFTKTLRWMGNMTFVLETFKLFSKY